MHKQTRSKQLTPGLWRSEIPRGIPTHMLHDASPESRFCSLAKSLGEKREWTYAGLGYVASKIAHLAVQMSDTAKQYAAEGFEDSLRASSRVGGPEGHSSVKKLAVYLLSPNNSSSIEDLTEYLWSCGKVAEPGDTTLACAYRAAKALLERLPLVDGAVTLPFVPERLATGGLFDTWWD